MIGFFFRSRHPPHFLSPAAKLTLAIDLVEHKLARALGVVRVVDGEEDNARHGCEVFFVLGLASGKDARDEMPGLAVGGEERSNCGHATHTRTTRENWGLGN